jgi:hypothetical protein
MRPLLFIEHLLLDYVVAMNWQLDLALFTHFLFSITPFELGIHAGNETPGNNHVHVDYGPLSLT